MTSSAVRKIPSTKSKAEIERQLQQYDSWFYQFDFDNGAVTPPQSAEALWIHQSRANMFLPFLDRYFQGRWSQVRCLDIACHQGWFALQIALRGAKSVEGIDLRADHIAQATLVRDLGALHNLSYRQAAVFELEPQADYDLTLVLGLLYHLENPLGALRRVYAMTSELCIIETQVAKTDSELHCLWGTGQPRQGPGIAVVRADAAHATERAEVTLVPTLEALYDMLYAVGFSHLYLGIAPQTVHEQFQYPGPDRVIVFAQVTNPIHDV